MNVTRHISTLLYTTVLTLAAQSAFAAFSPVDNYPATGSKTLPDTSALYQHDAASGTSGLPRSSSPLPLYPSRAIIMPTAPATIVPAQTAQIVAPAPVITPAQAVVPAPEPKVIAAAPSSAPNFPPVDAAVASQAQAQLAAAEPNPLPGFIAPAPLMAATTPPSALPEVTAAPIVAAAPEPKIVAAAPVAPAAPAAMAAAPAPVIIAPAPAAPVIVASAPAELPPVVTPAVQPLSTQSKNILAHVPSKIESDKSTKYSKLKLQRVSPDVDAVLGKDTAEQKYESVGLSIKVRRPGLDANTELNNAYTSLMGGDTEAAVQTYKNILSTDPKNQDALFGLAATYHRRGDLDHARPLYGQLLKINPNHREGLNNFLALISDESPQEALAELERLEQRNPDFSPIPAQQAIVLDKLGYVEESREKMLRAIQLAPDNLSYKYNLAVMSDRNGNLADASALYRLLIDAGLKGEQLPAPVAELQKRLNFITSTAAAKGVAVGG